MEDKTLIGIRPPLDMEYREKIREVLLKINAEALRPFTPHDILELSIDRMHAAYFPERHTDAPRKMFYRLEF